MMLYIFLDFRFLEAAGDPAAFRKGFPEAVSHLCKSFLETVHQPPLENRFSEAVARFLLIFR